MPRIARIAHIERPPATPADMLERARIHAYPGREAASVNETLRALHKLLDYDVRKRGPASARPVSLPTLRCLSGR
jgi:hypothetical protein